MSETQIRELFSRHADSTEPPLPPRFVAQSIDAGRNRKRRRRAARAAVGGVAAFAAVAIGATAIVGAGADGGSAPDGDRGQETVVAGPPDAVTLLGQISRAASERRVDIRDDQFIYEKRQFVTKFPTPINGRTEVAGVSESWESVDGTKPGLAVFPDKLGRPATVERQVVVGPSLMEPTYRYLTTLPTDPDALLDQVRALVDARPGKAGSTVDRDQDAFDLIGIVLGHMLPPQLGGALYRAAAKIPGVTVIPAVTDSAGRSGIAVSRSSTVGAGSARWIFDSKTYEFLGASINHSKVATEDSTFAVLTRGVVDRVRETP